MYLTVLPTPSKTFWPDQPKNSAAGKKKVRNLIKCTHRGQYYLAFFSKFATQNNKRKILYIIGKLRFSAQNMTVLLQNQLQT
jgi:hypothetical protein